MMEALKQIASSQKIELNEITRNALYREMERLKETSRVVDFGDLDDSERVFHEIAQSMDWIELKARLLHLGYLVRRTDTDICLVSAKTSKFWQWPGMGIHSFEALQDKFGPALGLGGHIPKLDRVKHYPVV